MALISVIKKILGNSEPALLFYKTIETYLLIEWVIGLYTFIINHILHWYRCFFGEILVGTDHPLYGVSEGIRSVYAFINTVYYIGWEQWVDYLCNLLFTFSPGTINIISLLILSVNGAIKLSKTHFEIATTPNIREGISGIKKLILSLKRAIGFHVQLIFIDMAAIIVLKPLPTSIIEYMRSTINKLNDHFCEEQLGIKNPKIFPRVRYRDDQGEIRRDTVVMITKEEADGMFIVAPPKFDDLVWMEMTNAKLGLSVTCFLSTIGLLITMEVVNFLVETLFCGVPF
jgi:hypothetical protein